MALSSVKVALSRRHGGSISPCERGFVSGICNWLFSDSVKGAEASAMLYSLAATATANGMNVERYFAELLSARQALLPWLK